MEQAELRRRFAASPVARLATVRPDGSPHIVVVVFALVGNTIFTAVDAKPKRSRQLQRLTNLAADPRCALIVDHYLDDWSRLWWVRADGVASILDPPDGRDGTAALIRRHPQYRITPPPGPVIAIEVTQWSGWSAQSAGTAARN